MASLQKAWCNSHSSCIRASKILSQSVGGWEHNAHQQIMQTECKAPLNSEVGAVECQPRQIEAEQKALLHGLNGLHGQWKALLSGPNTIIRSN